MIFSISTLNDLIQSGDRILKIEGVLSGSLSFIFNSFTEGVKFSSVVKQAKELGFTLKEIKELTLLLYSNTLTKSDMGKKLAEKSHEITLKISELKKIQALIDNVLLGTCEYKNKLV